MTQFWAMPFLEAYRLFVWWVWLVPRRITVLIYNWLLNLDEILVLGETTRLWLAIEPLFGDYDWKGRIIGFFFRFMRIVISLAIYLGTVVVGIALLIGWLLLPVGIVLSIFGLW